MHRGLCIPRHSFIAVATCLLVMQAFGLTRALAFSNSDGGAALTLNGSAKTFTGPGGGTVLLLTSAQQYQAGSAFTTNSIAFSSTSGFHTFFQFKMTDPGPDGPSDGMAFVLQTAGASALGDNGGYLGYAGIAPSVAVEFDTWQNSWDINDNHVAVLANGQMNDVGPKTPYGVTNCQPSTGVFGCMSNGDTWSVWIDYDGTILHVAIADNSTTRPADLMDYPIDIPSILGQSSAFAGFTAGTGSGFENHVIANWRFR